MPKSKSDTHITPDVVFSIISFQWGYEKEDMFDPCPVGATDGLEIDWKKLNFVNPPYGDGKKDENGNTLLARFVHKAILESRKGNITVMLLPSKTDQDWFHQLDNLRLSEGYNIIWISGRLKFKNNKWAATQPHFLVRVKD